ncbi:MAG: polyphosphate polymerase domain-containing protein [Tannerella sp.]|jgi:hypothetical protein|nr:polyphosphate polymerase domain-containing protein [Tannerella sp.]
MNIPISSAAAAVLDGMTPVTLAEMQGVRLMNRIDCKFAAPALLFRQLMEDVAPHFKIQADGDRRIAPYRTQYLDTPGFDLFVMHHNGRMNRQKIRIRTYEDSGISFLEIKNKNNRGRTGKIRIPIHLPCIRSVADLGESHIRFLNENAAFAADSLQPALSNRFDRITLVNNNESERVTVDLNLSFLNHVTGSETQVDNLMILELKQAGRQPSPFRDALCRLRIHPRSFSKYCMGSVLTNPRLKYNRFKSTWISITKITH